MTKALHCQSCNAVKSFNPTGGVTACDCGKVEGWWVDAENGIAALYTRNPDDRPIAHIISLHNGFLNDAPNMIPTSYQDPLTQKQMPYPAGQSDTFWRHLHDQACIAPPAPETVRLFDRAARGCWVVIIEPGMTADTQWGSTEDYQKHRTLIRT